MPTGCGLSLNLTISYISKSEFPHAGVMCTPFPSSPLTFCFIFYILDALITNFEGVPFGRIASEDLLSLSRTQVPEKPLTEKKKKRSSQFSAAEVDFGVHLSSNAVLLFYNRKRGIIGVVLWSVTWWIRHAAAAVRTKALIIHFLLDKSPCAERSDGPAVG